MPAAWCGWIVFCLLAALKTVLAVEDSPVNRSYSYGAKLWWLHEGLYDGEGTGFIYLPQSAVLQLPFIFLPGPAHDFAWRIVTIGLFALGIWKLSRLCERHESVAIFPLVTLLTLPKTWTVAVNGQATPAMAGLMMIAVAEIARRRWWRGALAFLLALAFKPLAIVLILLAGALYAPLRWRLVLGAILFLAFPFVTQDPQYVLEQYRGFVGNLGDSAHIGLTNDWPQVFSLLQVFGIELSHSARTLTQISLALVTLVAAWQACRSLAAGEAAIVLYALAASYLLLLNPRTENNTYSMLVPAIALLAARAMQYERRSRRALYLMGLIGALTGGYELCKALTPGAPFVWPCVVGCLAFTGDLALEIFRTRSADTAVIRNGGLPQFADESPLGTEWRAA